MDLPRLEEAVARWDGGHGVPAELLIDAARDLVAAEDIQRCEVHLSDYHDGAPGCVFWMFAKVVQDRYGTEEPRPCSVISARLVL